MAGNTASAADAPGNGIDRNGALHMIEVTAEMGYES
jgi:hypothetical protein